MNHEADEQLELLEQLLREEPFRRSGQSSTQGMQGKQGKQENEQQQGEPSVTAAFSSTANSWHEDERETTSSFASVVETRPDRGASCAKVCRK